MRGNNFRLGGASSADYLITSAILAMVLLLGASALRTFQSRQIVGRGDQLLQSLVLRLQSYVTEAGQGQSADNRVIGYALVLEKGQDTDNGIVLACAGTHRASRAGIVTLRYSQADHSVTTEPASCPSTSDTADFITLAESLTVSSPIDEAQKRWFFPVLLPSDQALRSEVHRSLVRRGGAIPLVENASATITLSHRSSGSCRSFVFLPDETLGLAVHSQEGCVHADS